MSTPTYIVPPLDSNPDDLYQGFVTYMQTVIPGWEPYSGELDDWLGRAFSGIAAQLTEISTDVATSVYRYFGANIVNVPPIAAQPAVAITTWTAQDTTGYTIPAFTQFTLTDPTGNQQGFETTANVVIPNGQSVATNVVVYAAVPGSDANGSSGAAANVPLAFITGVTTTTAAANGTDDEDDTTYLNRLTATFLTLSPKPITTSDFSQLVLNEGDVGRVVTIGGYVPGSKTQTGTVTSSSASVTALSNPSAIAVGDSIMGTNIPSNTFIKSVNVSGSSAVMSANATGTATETITLGGSLNNGGSVTSWVTALDGTALSTPAMNTIQADIQAQCLIGVNYYVEPPTYTTVNITATVYAWAGQDNTAIQSAIQGALTTYLSPLNWGQQAAGGPGVAQWLADPTIRLSQVEFVIMSVAGVHYTSDASILINGTSADLSLAGVVALPLPGTMTITVNTG